MPVLSIGVRKDPSTAGFVVVGRRCRRFGEVDARRVWVEDGGKLASEPPRLGVDGVSPRRAQHGGRSRRRRSRDGGGRRRGLRGGQRVEAAASPRPELIEGRRRRGGRKCSARNGTAVATPSHAVLEGDSCGERRAGRAARRCGGARSGAAA